MPTSASKQTAPAVGIDLGTTYSCVGVFKNGTVEIIANDQGKRTTPSMVAFSDTQRLVGDAAKNQASLNPRHTIFDAKRLIGRKFSDSTVQSDLRLWPFKVAQAANDQPVIEVLYKGETKQFTPEEVSSMVLQKMKGTAESYLGGVVRDAVVTVPAYFNDAQRQATKDAGAIAGLKVLRVLNEPTAAALAYGLNKEKHNKSTAGERHVLIFDLGGGTFDVSLLAVEKQVFEVLATSGDTHLGGEDFDNILVTHFCKEFKRKHKKDLTTSNRALRRLRSACERAKRTLSSSAVAQLEIDALFQGIDFHASLTRARFQDLCGHHFRDCLKPVERVLLDAKLTKEQVDEIVLVGGSTRIPRVQELLSQFFNGKELERSINPDEAVAYGAAVQAAVLTGVESKETEEMVLIDVAPLSIGIEVAGGMMAKVVKRNSNIPCSRTQVFSTFRDNQTSVLIQVYQGERTKTKDNYPLGQFELNNIPPAPRGVPQIEVKFDLDANGILSVSATDKANASNSQSITIKNNKGTLSADDIERMLRDAEQFKAEDEQEERRISARNALEALAYHAKSSVNAPATKDKISADEVDEVTTAATDVIAWLDNTEAPTLTELQHRHKELEAVVTPITTKLHSAPGTTEPADHQAHDDDMGLD